ncbi:hypothetical protein NPIL_196981 [Nephila pilipes]|uniref:Uncharacterized protein n=1 Tax=Nephila pilipes TaxID=299642 RepID=A0A8X6U2Q5_NEPPI|nr:hypothetical protein NPIL_196981 [Nephila pilipes]
MHVEFSIWVIKLPLSDLRSTPGQFLRKRMQTGHLKKEAQRNRNRVCRDNKVGNFCGRMLSLLCSKWGGGTRAPDTSLLSCPEECRWLAASCTPLYEREIIFFMRFLACREHQWNKLSLWVCCGAEGGGAQELFLDTV